jgi:hypothetical protein
MRIDRSTENQLSKSILMNRLRDALQASWGKDTSYKGVVQLGNPALGQCYPTSHVVQHYFPQTEILKGTVLSGVREDMHFWNGLNVEGQWHHIDLSWQQFPADSTIGEFIVLDRECITDSAATIQRCELLLHRVADHLCKTNT